MEQNSKNEIIKNPFHKKVWYSMTKYEKYPEMAAEGVGRAVGYLMKLMLVFAILVGIALVIQFHNMAKNGIDFLDKYFTEINYKDGVLTLASQDETITNTGNVKINTNELTSEQLKKYEEKSNKPEFIWLRDRVIAKYASTSMTYYYKDVLDGYEIKEFNKDSLINLLNQAISKPQLYLVVFIGVFIYIFVVYLVSALIDILILSLFGVITSFIARIQIRYRAIFNMSVYAITLSTILRVIYMYVSLFTDFTIKYFDIMYSSISFICLAAAIFMIKSDVIKQQIEIMKMIEIKKQEQGENETEQDEKEEKKDEEEEKNDKKEEKKDEKPVEDGVESEGSNA